MEHPKRVPMCVRVTQETLDLVRRYAASAHSHGVLVEEALKAYLLKADNRQSIWSLQEPK
jgi:hypothetical protein